MQAVTRDFLQLTVKFRCSKTDPPGLATPHKRNDADKKHCIDYGQDTPSNPPCRGMSERHHVEAQCKTEDQSAEVQERADLGRLSPVAISAVSKYIRADDLQAESTDPNAQDRANLVGLIL